MTNKYIPVAQQAAPIVAHVLAQNGLMSPSAYNLAEHNGMTWLIVEMNPIQLGPITAYKRPELLNHMSAALGGLPVSISNLGGLRYGVLLSPKPRLPWMLPFPGVRRGDLRIGRTWRGEASISWKTLNKQGHIMVAGMTGSGKSTLLRSIVLQAMAEGDICRLSDKDGITFPILEGNPHLDMPIAHSNAEISKMVSDTYGECANRGRMYKAIGGSPNHLEQYNEFAVKAEIPTLQRILLVLDEFPSTIHHLGGIRGEFCKTLDDLSWQGRKFGIVIVFATQAITQDIVGHVRDQAITRICFRIAPTPLLAQFELAGADKIPMGNGKSGRAMTNLWGMVQTYWVDNTLLGTPQTAPVLTERERTLYEAAQSKGGRLTRLLISTTLGTTVYDARKIQTGLEELGWIAKVGGDDNAFHVTERWEKIANPPTNLNESGIDEARE